MALFVLFKFLPQSRQMAEDIPNSHVTFASLVQTQVIEPLTFVEGKLHERNHDLYTNTECPRSNHKSTILVQPLAVSLGVYWSKGSMIISLFQNHPDKQKQVAKTSTPAMAMTSRRDGWVAPPIVTIMSQFSVKAISRKTISCIEPLFYHHRVRTKFRE